jgi:undecaprenyl-diphosphatase
VSINQQLFQLIYSVAHRSFLFDQVIVFLASYAPIILGVLFFYKVFFGEFNSRLRLAFLCESFLSVLLSRGIITETIQFFYHASRPFVFLAVEPLLVEGAYTSFPSGHAAVLFALAATVYFYDRAWGMWFFVFAIVNGLARIASGVHFPLDVLSGALFGVTSAFLIRFFVRRFIAPLKPQIVD